MKTKFTAIEIGATERLIAKLEDVVVPDVETGNCVETFAQLKIPKRALLTSKDRKKLKQIERNLKIAYIALARVENDVANLACDLDFRVHDDDDFGPVGRLDVYG